jgi:hypothetical protein
VTRVRALRPVLVVTALLAVLLSLAGCVSMPTGGPVQAYPVTQGTDAQSQQYMQVEPESPGAGWNPQQIVQGFLAASASFATYRNVAKQYLTPQEGTAWKPNWSAVVYTNGPTAGAPTYPPNPKQSKQSKQPEAATVQVNGAVQSTLQGNGLYSVRSSKGSGTQGTYTFGLVNLNGQWRINSAPQQLLLTSVSFHYDYQLTNLYFFDPKFSHLVPDPVYVPVGAQQEELEKGLVNDLISPPNDWLLAGGATKTAFPKGTTIADVALSGATAVVNLKGAAVAKAGNTIMAEIAAQLWSTLDGIGQDQPNGQQVEQVEVERDGQPWTPPNSTDNSPVTQSSGSYAPPSGYYRANAKFYYVDTRGYLASASADGNASEVEPLSGTGYSQLAVSPDGLYVAALSVSGNTLYTGMIGSKLTPIRGGGSYTSISWAPNDYLWATGSTGISTADKGLGPMKDVQVDTAPGVLALTAAYNQLKVAPDGVRVAIIEDGGILTYGAISGLQTAEPQITLSTVTETLAANQVFQSLAWYDSNDVIALATNSILTKYPVSGASSTTIPAESGMQTITAESSRLLVGTVDSDGSPPLVSYSSSTYSWTPVTLNDTAAKDTPFTYPG